MKTRKILIVAGVAVSLMVIFQIVRRKKETRKRLLVVADEGYETAEDILFPKRKFLRLG